MLEPLPMGNALLSLNISKYKSFIIEHSSIYYNCRTLSNGQRGEVYEINGDQVAVIFDPPEEVVADSNKDEADKVQNAKPAVYWVDSMLLVPSVHIAIFSLDMPAIYRSFLFVLLAQDIERDHDTQAEDWHIALEALCEVFYLNITVYI